MSIDYRALLIVFIIHVDKSGRHVNRQFFLLRANRQGRCSLGWLRLVMKRQVPR